VLSAGLLMWRHQARLVRSGRTADAEDRTADAQTRTAEAPAVHDAA
jgi:hypothetical protein